MTTRDPTAPLPGYSRYIFALALIIIAAFTLRTLRIMSLPLFVDEATHIRRAQLINQGESVFIGLTQNKALYPVLLSIFRPLGPEAPFVGRYLSVLSGALGVAAAAALGRALGGRRAAVIAGLAYALMPFAVFHDRQALVDPLKGTFTTLAALFTVWIALRPRWRYGPLLAVSLWAAIMVKGSALPYLVVPPLGVLILVKRWREMLRPMLLSTLAVAAAELGRRWAFRAAAAQGIAVDQHEASASRLRLFAIGAPDTIAGIARTAGDLEVILRAYVGWIGLAVVILSLYWIVRDARRRALIFLWVPAVGLTLMWLFIEVDVAVVPARYLLSTPGPLAALIGVTLAVLFERWRRAHWLGARILPGAAMTLLLAPWLYFCAVLIANPDDALLSPHDDALYRQSPSAGGAFEAAARAIIARSDMSQPVNTMTLGGCCYWQTSIYLGNNGEHTWFGLQERPQLVRWLADGEEVYLIITNLTRFRGEPPDRLWTQTEFIDHFESGSVTIDLYRVTGTRDRLTELVLAELLPEPEKIAETLDAAALAASADGQQSVIVWPAAYAESFEGFDYRTLTLDHPTWPVTAESVEAFLNGEPSVAETDDGTPQQVALVRVDPLTSDPQQALPAVLGDRLYYARESWQTNIQTIAYLTGPRNPAFEPLNAEWEDAIHLDSLALVDRSIEPGGWLRLALNWSTSEAIGDSFSVFVHVVDAEGSLYAQYDGIPGGGLHPMTDWRPGQTIADRIAIPIPPDLRPGDYFLRIGVYQPQSGLRLRVTRGEGGGDYIDLGSVTAN